ncbi:DUF2971 domain-containing protein [Rhodococcus sp. 1163]|uniref:DUF2971 domain-containing protein n=1 Tax=Rhodococcus sp. 1163 TaxID=1905289 RepID=UPI00117AAD3E|nr:DUF2971 domain-containing protein [Rhodococcus sp. 1163]
MANVQILKGAEIADDTILWRYMNMTKLVDLLSTSQLAMPLASMMEDPYERDVGLASAAQRWHDQKSRGAPSYWLAADQDMHLKTAARLRSATYITCWNALDTESAAMWKIYGESGGIAIQTTWSGLRDSLVSEKHFYGGKVIYLDYNKDALPTTTHTDDYFYKRSSFSFEHEVRLISHAPDCERFLSGKDEKIRWPKVDKINIDLGQLAPSVYVAPQLPEWVRDAVQALTLKFGHGWEINQSTLYTPREPNYWPEALNARGEN